VSGEVHAAGTKLMTAFFAPRFEEAAKVGTQMIKAIQEGRKTR